jgi:hypothetical protein
MRQIRMASGKCLTRQVDFGFVFKITAENGTPKLWHWHALCFVVCAFSWPIVIWPLNFHLPYVNIALFFFDL